jgi:hypothetical protein
MSLRLRLPAALAGAACAVALGCGGEEAGAYVFQPTRECLREQNVVVTSADLDFVASTALGGALRARLAGNEAVLAFGEDEEDGAAIERAYRRFAGKNVGLQDVLMRERNVVLVWAGKPSDDQLERVRGCLRTND